MILSMIKILTVHLFNYFTLAQDVSVLISYLIFESEW